MQGIVSTTSKGYKIIHDGEKFTIPTVILESHKDDDQCQGSNSRKRNKSADKSAGKSIRIGKGTHGLVTIRKLIEDEENWKKISEKSDYQFPGVFPTQQSQRALFVDDCMKLPQACVSNPHFLWDDVQISKGSWNKDREVTVTIAGKAEKLMYRVAPCNGVKLCPQKGCDYAAPMSAQRPCYRDLAINIIKS